MADRPASTDEAILKQYLSGDTDAFGVLVRRHEDRLFALALRLTGDRADALDATQDAFIAAFRQAASFRGDSAFSTWLYRIAVNSCQDLLRRRKRAPIPEEELPEPRTNTGSSVAETVALRLDLAVALEALSPDYREAVCLHDLGGVPYDDIARLTGVSIGTVKSRISRGRRKLAVLMGEAGETSSEHVPPSQTSKDSI